MTPEAEEGWRLKSRGDLLSFTRWMFKARKGAKWELAPSHHYALSAALMRVYAGKTKRLIINMPPRYSKTEFVENFIAWSLGQYPDCEFIYTSYSARLAAKSSWDCREIVNHPEYKAVFPGTRLRDDSAAKDEWRTTAGGLVYAAGSGGTITGYGAGKMRPGFGGCFSYETKVWTEKGMEKIGDIVKNKMRLNVWSFDYAGKMVLRPVTGWHENPGNSIYKIRFSDGAEVECTACHRFWTTNRGWVRADSLRKDDRLPRVESGVESLDNIRVNPEARRKGLDSVPVFSPRAGSTSGLRNIGHLSCELRSVVGVDTAMGGDIIPTRDGLPCLAAPDLIHDKRRDSVSLGKDNGRNADRVVNAESRFIIEDGTRVGLSLAESSVHLAVIDVLGASIVPEVGEDVIRGVSVTVADVHSCRTLSNKSQHYKGVDRSVFDFAPDRQRNSDMTGRVSGPLQDAASNPASFANASIDNACRLPSDAPEVADRVDPFISGDRFPVLIKFVRHDPSVFCLTVEEYHNFTVEQGLVVKNCIVVDDPHKADEATSDVMRANVIDWFQNTLESRLNSPDTPIIVIMQRLHEGDLSGWLLRGGNGEKWDALILPAIREDGSALWPYKHNLERLRQMEQAAPYHFAGQYLQRPAPLEGGVIKPDRMTILEAIPAGTRFVRGWDLAATEKKSGNDPDWTVGAKLGQMPDGRWIIADITRLQGGPEDVEAAIKSAAVRDGTSCIISIPQDPGQAGKAQAKRFSAMLGGWTANTSPESGDKVTRAQPFAAQVNVGNVCLLKAPWNDALIAEMRLFPNATHDDQIDACSRAFVEITQGGGGLLDHYRQMAEAAKSQNS